MKKSIILTLAIVFMLSISGTALGAASFSDVPAKHWAYDAVSQLQKTGFVDGYGDGTFRGDKPLTRYEFASLTARGLQNYDKANARQKALLDKLAAEFAAELNNIGVRVSKLEKNQPNLKITGSSEVRYTSQDYNDSTDTAVGGAYRIRLDGVAKVDEDTVLGLRLASGVTKAGTKYKYSSASFTSFGTTSAADDNKNTFTLDRYFLTRKIGTVNTTIGAQELKLGTTNFIVDSGYNSFDGVKLATKLGEVNLVGNWGRQQKNAAVKAGHKIDGDGNIVDTAAIPETTIDVASLEASTKVGNLTYGLGYATLKDNGDTPGTLAKYLYGNASYAFAPNLSLAGEYVQNRQNDDNNNAWAAVATIGDQVIAKKGQNNVVAKYWNVGENSISRLTSYSLQNKAAAGVTDVFTDVNNIKGWSLTYNYGFSKNLAAYVQFAKVTDKDATTSANDRGFQYSRVAVTAKF